MENDADAAEQRDARIEGKLDRLQWWLILTFGGFAASILLLAINLIVGTIGPPQ